MKFQMIMKVRIRITPIRVLFLPNPFLIASKHPYNKHVSNDIILT